jgi:hypothetical protein
MAHAQACEVGVTVETQFGILKLCMVIDLQKMFNFYQDNFFLYIIEQQNGGCMKSLFSFYFEGNK